MRSARNPGLGKNETSFFHFFASKKELAGTLFLEIIARYHAAVLAAVDGSSQDAFSSREPVPTPDQVRGRLSLENACYDAKQGVARLIHAHLDWVVNNRREARYLFEISRSEWSEEIRGAQRAQNSRLAEAIERWRAPLIERGELLPMTATLFFSQIIGPAQIFCRAFLSGRDRTDPRDQAETLIACATRAVVAADADHSKGETA